MAKQFKWLLDGCESRQGRRLEKGQVYDAGSFPELILAEWVRTHAAEWVSEIKPKARKEGE